MLKARPLNNGPGEMFSGERADVSYAAIDYALSLSKTIWGDVPQLGDIDPT